jgi:hypothetical protein
MNYQDFILEFNSGAAAGACVPLIVRSPGGEGSGSFAIPIGRPDLDLLAQRVARSVVGDPQDVLAVPSREVVRARKQEAAGDLRVYGDRLFRALFAGQIRSRYDASVGRLRGREEAGLRFKVDLGLRTPDAAWLHALPWEYLYDHELDTFLALSRQASVARYVHLALPGDERPPRPLPLRILIAMAEPDGVPPLKLANEVKAIEKAWSSPGVAEVVSLRHATLERLREELLSQRINVLHFMGHGDFDSRTGEGVLILENERGQPHPVSGAALADQLRDCSSLQLVFLNACRTAQAAAPGPFSGVSTALLQAGVPAVLAMQFPISDDAALAFSEVVYRRLAAGDSIDEAVAEGRLAIRRRLPDSMEWGTPVLFLRAPDGRLFLPPAGPVRETETVPVRRSGPPWQRYAAALLVGVSVWAVTANLPALLNTPSEGEPERASRDATADSTRGGASEPEKEESREVSNGGNDTAPAEPPKPEERREDPGEKRVAADTVQEEEATQVASEPPPPPPRPSSYSVAEGETVPLGILGATASVQFLALGSQSFAKLTVSAEGAPPVDQAVMGGESLEVPAAGGTFYVDVLSVNKVNRSVTVKPRTS